MSAIRIAIVDDEEHFIQIIMSFIEAFCQEKNCCITTSVFRDGEDITENYQAEFDIIFMDIQMRFMDGMMAAEKIRELDKKVILLFITNMAGYAIQGYAVEAFDYILKPLSYQIFAKKLERAIGAIEPIGKHYITLAVKDGFVRLDASQVHYIEARSHQMIYHTKDTTYSIRGKMDELEAELMDYGFFRSNRGYLVNLYQITAVQDGCCIIHGDVLPIARQKKKALMEHLMKIM